MADRGWAIAGWMVVAACGCRFADERESSSASEAVEVEAQSRFEPGTWIDEAALCASGGRCLTSSPAAAGAGALAHELTLELPAGAAAELWMRCSHEQGELSVEMAGGSAARCAATGHLERFEWRAMGRVEARAEARGVRLRWSGAAPGGLRLDQWTLRPPGAGPPDDTTMAVHRSEDGTLEVRAAVGASLPDPEWVLKLLREQRDAVVAELAVAPPPLLLLLALPSNDSLFADHGAAANGCALLLRADELHLPWRNYVHEIVHVIEQERGWQLPWVASEGVAVALATELSIRQWGDQFGHDEQRRRRAELEAWKALVGEPRTREEREAAYGHAAALVEAAAAIGGAEFYRRLAAAFDRARAALAGGETPSESLRRARRGLEEAAGKPLDDLFIARGWLE